MSSTNRGAQRQPDDFYSTPTWAARAILPHLGSPRSVLDPACGDGAILDVFADSAQTIGFEIDDERGALAAQRHGVVIRDALSPTPWPQLDAIVANPPYALAMQFLERALAAAARTDATVAFLLRLNFLGSQKRAVWHRAHPSDVYILPRRPSFLPDGKTDSCEYAWLCWGPGRGGRWSILEVER